MKSAEDRSIFLTKSLTWPRYDSQLAIYRNFFAGNKLLFFVQIRERKQRESLEKRNEQDDNFTEISNNIFGDMLTENPAVAISAFGSHRSLSSSPSIYSSS